MSFAYFSGIMVAVFWIIVYVLILYVSVKDRQLKKKVIPCIAVCFNISWELACTFRWPNWGKIIAFSWCLINLVIIWFAFRALDSDRKKKFYGIILICVLILDCVTFEYIKIILYNAYIINLVMSAAFWIERKEINVFFKIPIAITKLIGNVFALFAFGNYYHYTLGIIESVALIFDFMYLGYCFAERRRMRGVLIKE